MNCDTSIFQSKFHILFWLSMWHLERNVPCNWPRNSLDRPSSGYIVIAKIDECLMAEMPSSQCDIFVCVSLHENFHLFSNRLTRIMCYALRRRAILSAGLISITFIYAHNQPRVPLQGNPNFFFFFSCWWKIENTFFISHIDLVVEPIKICQAD